MKKYCVITTIEQKNTAFFYENESLSEIRVLSSDHPNEQQKLKLKEIYTAKVKNIIANINAAFIDICGQICYYSMEDNKYPIFVNPKKDNVLHEGDELLVQIHTEAVKNKKPVTSCYLQLTGNHLILTYHKPGIGISKKISGDTRDHLYQWLTEFVNNDSSEEKGQYGFIVRTNASYASKEQILADAKKLVAQLHDIVHRAQYMKAGTCLLSASEYQDILNQISSADDSYIITDCKKIYDEFVLQNQIRSVPVDIQWHESEISLSSIYDLQKTLSNALEKKVWLKSGGYLIIEPTEAMTVIDVNTGKSIQSKSTKEEHLLKINIEAADEIAKQLRIRNISGIIIVDFIDLSSNSHQESLLSHIKEKLREDSIKTTLVDMTPLGLVEITRHKMKRPLHEQWQKKEEL